MPARKKRQNILTDAQVHEPAGQRISHKVSIVEATKILPIHQTWVGVTLAQTELILCGASQAIYANNL